MNKTEKYWDRMAKDVDPEADQPEPNQVRMAEKIAKHLKGHETLLDYGCARGGISFLLANKAKQIQGIDISSKMIAIAKKRAASRQLGNVTFAHAQLTDPQYSPSSFDVIVALNIIHLVDDAGVIVALIHELLKPGGLFISETPCLKGRNTVMNMIGRSLLALGYKLGFVPHVELIAPKEWETMVTQQGFQAVEIQCAAENANFLQWIVAKKV